MINIETWQASPASYNITNDLAVKSQIYPNPPRPFIGKGKRNPSMFISNAQSKEWLCTCSPSVASYSPNTTMLYKSTSVPKFGKEQRKDHFAVNNGRSPGPIYSFPMVSARATSFGKGNKGFTNINEVPSPNTYNPSTVQTKLPIKIKGYLSEKIYSRNYEKYYKGQIGPGPAGYSIVSNSVRSFCIPKAEKLKSSKFYLVKNDNPGPGAYGEMIMKPLKKKAMFGGRRNLDVRSCNY